MKSQECTLWTVRQGQGDSCERDKEPRAAAGAMMAWVDDLSYAPSLRLLPCLLACSLLVAGRAETQRCNGTSLHSTMWILPLALQITVSLYTVVRLAQLETCYNKIYMLTVLSTLYSFNIHDSNNYNSFTSRYNARVYDGLFFSSENKFYIN